MPRWWLRLDGEKGGSEGYTGGIVVTTEVLAVA